jgi:hypothetical protein
MAKYQYKVVPFRGELKQGITSTDTVNKVSQQLEELINSYASQGWEFYSLDSVSIRVSSGCLGFGSASVTTFDQAIFRWQTGD